MYAKHTERNRMIRWSCTCLASNHRSYIHLLLLTAKFYIKKYFFKEYLLVLPKCIVTKTSAYHNGLIPKCPITKMSCYKNVCYKNVHYQSVLYQNVWIPKSTARDRRIVIFHSFCHNIMQAINTIFIYYIHT